jgi:alcohol dehydrogenase
MESFSFRCATKIVFGKNTENQVGTEIKPFGKKVLIHYGTGSIKKSGLYDRVAASLKKEGIAFVELSGAVPNPRLSLVRTGIALCRKEKVDCILAIGGGSAIDSAKAIAIGVPYSGDVWDFYAGKASPEKALPIATVLTIPAAGSEASSSSVITTEDGNYKKAVTADCLRPVFSILNPELTVTLPPFQTACGAADIMAHVMERYFTNVKDVDFTDRLCEATLRTIIDNVPKVLKNPTDYAARAEIMWAGTIAHNDLLGTGRNGDWSSHGIEHELSGLYDVIHGAGLAVIFPAWMKFVYQHDLPRFVQFARRVWNVPASSSPDNTALAGIDAMKKFFKSIGLPVTLSELGIKDNRSKEMSQRCAGDGTIGSFVALAAKDIEKIFALAA